MLNFYFFYYTSISFTLIEIFVLWICIVCILFLFYKIKPMAAYIYTLFIIDGFCTILNRSYYFLNRTWFYQRKYYNLETTTFLTQKDQWSAYNIMIKKFGLKYFYKNLHRIIICGGVKGLFSAATCVLNSSPLSQPQSTQCS